MTGAEAQASPAARRELAAMGALYVAAVLLYVLLGRGEVVPLVSPDEFTYGHLARSLADGHGFTWRGDPVHLRSALYVLAIAPTWLVHNTLTAYALTKALGAALLSTLIVPVWLLARQVCGSRAALLVATLALAGTWMVTSALVLTENLALPLATGCLAATVTAIRRPGSHWGFVALALAALAAWARFQLVLLLPVIVLALVIDVARTPAGDPRAARLRAHGRVLVIAAAVLAIGLVVAIADYELVTGSYSGTQNFAPSAGSVVSAIGKSWIALFTMAGFLPLVVAASLGTSRRAWRDEAAGPLLAVLVPATVLFVTVSGWATAGFRVPWPIQRYVEYVLPLAFVLLGAVAARPALLPRRAWVIGLLLGAGVLLGPAAEPLEGRAYYAVATGARQLLGAAAGTGTAIAALLVAGAGLALLLVWPQPNPRALGAGGCAAIALTLLVVALQGQAGWRWQIDQAHLWRSGFPADLRAVDHAAGGPLARTFLTTSHSRFETVDFFNRDITQAFVPDRPIGSGRTLQGRTCVWSVDRGGLAHFESGCGARPSRLYLDDPTAVLTFAGEQRAVRIAGLGRVVEVPGPPAPLRLRAIAIRPCDDRSLVLRGGRVLGFAPRRCRGALSLLEWLDAPGTLAVAVRGGAAVHSSQVGRRLFRLPARRVTTIRVQVPRGFSRLDMRFDRQELPAGLPDVDAVILTQGGSRHRLL